MSVIASRLRRLARAERGQAVLETALVLPLLLILTFGIAEMGLFMFDYVQAANCAREAARRAAVRTANAASPPLCVSDTLQPVLSDANYATLAAGSPITATVDSTHTWIIIGNLIPGLGASTQIHAAVTMRMEAKSA